MFFSCLSFISYSFITEESKGLSAIDLNIGRLFLADTDELANKSAMPPNFIFILLI